MVLLGWIRKLSVYFKKMDIAPMKGKDIIAVFGKRERSC